MKFVNQVYLHLYVFNQAIVGCLSFRKEQEIHGLLRQGVAVDNISSQLSPWASALFEFMPSFIRRQLLLYPESDDSAQLSQFTWYTNG
ncbi:pyrophosphate--fructose 6-phosphate 1-phosphotransferase subunit alpha-like [Cajanus cajan]|uniref:pyrophosphate--fructose 6-phosphate 1-phosphotransferase subunit alpha-like n=1 Tax=Cajanus cajan TaxID=3821 RepID=UPI0010FB8A65|nr:pyrophosphate--fructose 6-phosphate 1-phosphotransferase subunit alpha-like [Cajanus cajan]